MAKTRQQLESRLSRVERDLESLKAALQSTSARPWYQNIAGDFAGDKTYAEIIRLGRLIRSGKAKG